MHVLGRRPLRFLQQLGIEAKLEHRPRLRFARELGVHHLVRPGSEAALALDPAQDVGTPNPAVMGQRALSDDLDAILHGRKRIGDCLIRYFSTFDADDVQTLTGQMRDIPFLVRQTPFPENLEIRIPYLGPDQRTLGRGKLQLGKMAAIEVRNQVGGAEFQEFFCSLHKE